MIVFLHIPKTAGSTFQFILENSFGPFACHTDHTKKPVFDQSDFNFTRKMFPGLRSISSGHNPIDPLSLSVPDPFFMTFLREPVARVFSHYQDWVLSDHPSPVPTFEETLRKKEILQNLQVKSIAGRRDLDKAKRALERCSFVGLTGKIRALAARVGTAHALSAEFELQEAASRRKATRSRKPWKATTCRSKWHENTTTGPLVVFLRRQRDFSPSLRQSGLPVPSNPIVSHDHYASELRWNYLLGHFYNMSFYRQICKFRNRCSSRAAASDDEAGK